MAEVRSHDGVPTAADFGGFGAPSPGTPIVIDSLTGDIYTLIGTAVVKSASIGVLYGSGVPASGLGANGNFYWRSDGAAGTFGYHKAAGVWSAFI